MACSRLRQCLQAGLSVYGSVHGGSRSYADSRRRTMEVNRFESDFSCQLLGWTSFDSTPISETKLPCSSCIPPGGANRPRVPEFGRCFEIQIASIGQDRPSLQCGNSRDTWVSGSGHRVLAAVPGDLKTARRDRYIPVVRALAAPEQRPA